MDSKYTTHNAWGFYIWFDKSKKKEYYATPVTLYRAKIYKSKNSIFPYISYVENYIPKVSPKKNRPIVVRNLLKLKLLDMNKPYEERLGMFLLNFLNANFDDFYSAYKDFFYAYSFELLDVKYHKLKMEYKGEQEYRSIIKKLFEEWKIQLLALQIQFRECVDYMYNLNGNEDDKDIDPYIKFQAYSAKNNFKHTSSTEMLFSSLSIFKNDYVKVKFNHAQKKIDNGTLDVQAGIKYKCTNISNVCYLILNELASNNVKIKVCKNCGRYFTPVNRAAEIYCDLTPRSIGGKKCRELGARKTYSKNIQEVEGLLIYRRTYQRRIMQVSRKANPRKEKEKFEKWRELAQEKIKEYKKGKINEEELKIWMEENKDM